MAHFGLALLVQKQIQLLLLTATGIGSAPSLVAFKQLSNQFANKGNFPHTEWNNPRHRATTKPGSQAVQKELELDPDTSPWTTQWKKSLLAASRLTDPPGAPRPQWCQQEWRGQPTHPINCWVLMNCAALQKLLVFTTKMHYFILPPTSVFIFSLWLLLFWFHLASTFLGFFSPVSLQPP